MAKSYRFVITVIVVIASYMMVAVTGLEEHGQVIEAVMWSCLVCCVLYLLFKCLSHRLTYEIAIGVLIFAGCIMRIGYMLYTPCWLRSHDFGGIDISSDGKDGYLLRIIQKNRLPESNANQLYQQPFYYLISAFCSKIINFILNRNDSYSLVNAAKVVSCIASSFTLLLSEKLLEFFGISKKSTLYALMLVAFSPVFYLTGGRVGEDALTTFFIVACLLFTLVWNKKPSWHNTVVLALLYGCGMMTKISVAIPAIFTLLVFLKTIFVNFRDKTKVPHPINKKQINGIFSRIIVFGCISLPLGLWYSVRNYFLFGQSLTYVLRQDNGIPQYTGDISRRWRVLPFDLDSIRRSPYGRLDMDYNLPTYLIKSELFGEFDYQIADWIPRILMYINIVLVVIICVCGLLLIMDISKHRDNIIILGWMLLFMSFTLNSYLSYPFCCTMDYRYYAILTVCKALVLGKTLDMHLNIQNKLLPKIILSVVKIVCMLFGGISCVMYCLVA